MEEELETLGIVLECEPIHVGEPYEEILYSYDEIRDSMMEGTRADEEK